MFMDIWDKDNTSIRINKFDKRLIARNNTAYDSLYKFDYDYGIKTKKMMVTILKWIFTKFNIKKDKFHREETFLPLDKITTAYFSLEEVLSNDWELVED